MIDLTFRAGVEDVEKKLGNLSEKANIVMARAANRTMSNVTKNIKKEISSKYRITSTEVGKTIKTQKASYSRPYASVKSVDVHPNLAKFKVSPFRKVKTDKKGIRSPGSYSAAVRKDSGLVNLSENPKPFVATMSNGFTGVFRRKSNSDKTLKGVYGPAVPQMLKGSGNIINVIENEAYEMMSKRIEKEISNILNKGRGSV